MFIYNGMENWKDAVTTTNSHLLTGPTFCIQYISYQLCLLTKPVWVVFILTVDIYFTWPDWLAGHRMEIQTNITTNKIYYTTRKVNKHKRICHTSQDTSILASYDLCKLSATNISILIML